MTSIENVIKKLFSYAISVNDNAFKVDDFLRSLRRYDQALLESKDKLIEILKEATQLFIVSTNKHNQPIVQIKKDPIFCLTYNKKSNCNNYCKYIHVCSCVFSSSKPPCLSQELEHNINCKAIKKVLRNKNLEKIDLESLCEFFKHFEEKVTKKEEINCPQTSNMDRIKVKLTEAFTEIGTVYLLEAIFSEEESIGGGEIKTCDYLPESLEAFITYKDEGVARRVFKKGKFDSYGYTFEIESIAMSNAAKISDEIPKNVGSEISKKTDECSSTGANEHKFILSFNRNNFIRLIVSKRNPSWRNRFYKVGKEYRIIITDRNIVFMEKNSEVKYKAWQKTLNEKISNILEDFYLETIKYNKFDQERISEMINKIEVVRKNLAIDYHNETDVLYLIASKTDAESFYKKYPQFKDCWNKPNKVHNIALTVPNSASQVTGFKTMLDSLLLKVKNNFPNFEYKCKSSTIELTGSDIEVASEQIKSCIDEVQVKKLPGFDDVRILQQKNLNNLIEECLKHSQQTNCIYKIEVKSNVKNGQKAGIYLSYFNKSFGSKIKNFNVFENVSSYLSTNIKTCQIEFDDQQTLKSKEWMKFEEEHLSELMKNFTCIYSVHENKSPKNALMILTSTKDYLMPIKLKIKNFFDKHECKTKIIVLTKKQYLYLTHVVKDLEMVIKLFSSEYDTKLEYNLNTKNKNSKYTFYDLQLTNPSANNLLMIEKLVKDELENLKTKTFQVESFEKLSNIFFDSDSQIKKRVQDIQDSTFTHITFKRVENDEKAIDEPVITTNKPIIGQNSIKNTIQTGGGILRLEFGSIIRSNADVILNSTTGQLELNSGYVSQLILKSAGQEIQAECKQNYPNGIDAKTIAVTSSGMMKNIKRIFHMAYLNKFTTNKDCVKDVMNAVTNCLELLIQMGFKSISIPSLGTGGLAYPPSIVAQTMVQTCYDFLNAAKSPLTINIVVSDMSMIQNFETIFLQFNGKSSSDGLKKIVDSRTFDQEPEGQEKIEFKIIYKSESDFTSAQEKVNELINDKYFTKEIIDFEFDEIMIKGEFKNLLKQFKNCYINVANKKISVKGLKEDVFEVKHKIIDFTHKEMKNTYSSIESHLQLTADIKWQYEWKRGEWKDFSLFNNSLINAAYVKKEKMVMFINEERVDSTIWFETMNYISSNNYKCRRLEVKKHGQIEYPNTWTEMEENCDFKLYKILKNTPEFNEVYNDFIAKIGQRTIHSIERVQNKTLYEAYSSHKKKLTLKNTNPNELSLFHGTKGASVGQICQFGFNRSYCGVNGVALGHGVYFAVNPATSDGFAIPDGNGKRMFRAKVLVGESTPGNSSMKVPPMRANNIPFDSTCNAGKQVFVAYHDNQCYPDYVITYT